MKTVVHGPFGPVDWRRSATILRRAVGLWPALHDYKPVDCKSFVCGSSQPRHFMEITFSSKASCNAGVGYYILSKVLKLRWQMYIHFYSYAFYRHGRPTLAF